MNCDNEYNTYHKLIALLNENNASYKELDHEPEGITDIVSEMRGHDVSEAAKCMIIMVKIGKKVTKFILAVVPGDAKVNIDAIKRMKGGTFARFADTKKAEELAGSVAGTVLPFSFHERLELMVDPSVLSKNTMYFNAARLDKSLALSTVDYKSIAAPVIENIALY